MCLFHTAFQIKRPNSKNDPENDGSEVLLYYNLFTLIPLTQNNIVTTLRI